MFGVLVFVPALEALFGQVAWAMHTCPSEQMLRLLVLTKSKRNQDDVQRQNMPRTDMLSFALGLVPSPPSMNEVEKTASSQERFRSGGTFREAGVPAE